VSQAGAEEEPELGPFPGVREWQGEIDMDISRRKDQRSALPS